MVGSLVRAVLLIVVLVGVAAFLLGWWGSGRMRSGGEPSEAIGTSGETSDRARQVGAEVGERTAAAAEQARRSLQDGSITAKIKAKLTLDDTVKALDVDVDTSGSTVTVSGAVDSAAQRDRVLQLARETEGVTEVVDRLRVRR